MTQNSQPIASDEKPSITATYAPIYNGMLLEPSAVKSMLSSMNNGGTSTTQLTNLITSFHQELRSLTSLIAQGENNWTDSSYNNMPCKVITSGDQYCLIAATTVDSHTQQALSLKDADSSRTIHVVFNSGQGLSILETFILVVSDVSIAYITERLLIAVYKEFILRLINCFQSISSYPIAPEIGLNAGELQALNQDIQNELGRTSALNDLEFESVEIVFELDSSLLSLASFAITLGEFIPILGIGLLIGYLIENSIKTYQLSLSIFNITKFKLAPSVEYLYNVAPNPNKSSNTILYPVSTGRFLGSEIPVSNSNNPVVSVGIYMFRNDSTFFKGVGTTLLVKPDDQNMQAVVATIDIPRIGDNSIATDFVSGSFSNFEGYFNEHAGRNQQTLVTTTSGNYRAIITISELSGADNDSYSANLFIVDQDVYTDFIQLVNNPQTESLTKYRVWVTFKDGYCVLNWSVAGAVIGAKDWVAMFPNKEAALSNPDKNFISPGNKTGWQWAKNGSSYQSSTEVNPGYVIAYIKDGRAIAISEPIHELSGPVAQTPSANYKVWVTFKDGYCVLNWSVAPAVIGAKDWVAMFPNKEAALSNPDKNFISPGDKTGWQWAKDGSSYQSSTKVNPGYVIAYIKDGRAITISEPIHELSAQSPTGLPLEASPPKYRVWVMFKDGYCVLNWSVAGAVIGAEDWVAMFPNKEAALSNPDKNFISPGDKTGWQWAKNGSSYQSSTKVNTGYVMAYIKDGCAIAISEPIHELSGPVAQTPSANYKVWVTFKDGYCVLNWSVAGAVIGAKDWVAMFPNKEAALSNPDKNFISPGNKTGWQWAKNGSSYQSSTEVNPGYVIAYIKDGRAIAISEPIGDIY